MHQDLTIVDVALSLALDDTKSLQAWLDLKLVSKPDKSLLDHLDSMEEKKYRFVIVQPFVLIQELSH